LATGHAGVVSADNARLYVSNFESNAVACTTLIGKLVQTLPAGGIRMGGAVAEPELFAGG